MQVGVLGPVEVTRDGYLVPIAGARMRALLTRLALGRGRAVPAGDLIDAVWGAAESDDPANALQSLVSRLRRALGDPASVVPTPGGYRLGVKADDVDVHRFETLSRAGRSDLRAGRYEDAAATLVQALSLWRGAALADLPDDPGAGPLDDARQAALEDRLEADLGRGLAAEAAAELEVVVAAAPMRERAVGLLMDALVADGRDAEALTVYERTRAVLADELGADPGAALAERHLRILRSERPPPAEPKRARTNLRAALTTFVGRDADMTAVAERLGEHRLVTLVGPGGAGKTRLAGEVGAAVTDRFRDGVWLVELAGVTDPDDVVGAAVGTLGVREAALFDSRSAGARRGPLDQLHDALNDRDLLLILDNCEHVLDAVAELVEYLLTRIPGLRILTTSRESLGLPGESLYPVPPLGHSSDGAAVTLFLDRARAIRSAPVDDLPAVEEICRRLDGLPLAIELAAARTRGLTVRQIADRLNDRFRLLSGGNRVAVARHRTLRAVVEWSWSLLTADERWLLEQLSVFAGGASVESADAIWTAAGRGGDTVDLLATLVDKSLLQLVNASTARYRMLETIREFGVDRLAERDELAVARARHADHFRTWAVSIEPLTRTSEQMLWIARLNDERDNIFAAIQHFVDTRAADDAVTLAMAMGWCWTMRGEHAVAVTWLGEALNVPGGTASADRTMASALRTMNTGVWTPGGDDPSMDVEALAVYADPELNPMAVVMLGVGLVFGDANAAAEKYLAEMIERTDGWPRATLLMVRALLAENDGNLELSRRSLNEALSAFRLLGERFGLASCLELHARLAVLDGDLAETLATLEQAAEITRELGAFEDAGATMCWRAGAQLRLRNPDAAWADLARGEVDFARVGSVFGAALIDTVRGQIQRFEGDLDAARITNARARVRIGADLRTTPPQAVAMLLVAAAEIEISDGRLDDGVALAAEATRTALGTRDLPIVSQTAVLWATIAWQRGDPALAAQLLGVGDGLRGAPDPTHPEVVALERDLSGALEAPELTRLRERGRGLPRDDALAQLSAAAGLESVVRPAADSDPPAVEQVDLHLGAGTPDSPVTPGGPGGRVVTAP